jgi:D-3-phosphoglycerate dehydrogenase
MIKILITDKLAQEGIDLINSTEGAEAVVKTGVSEDELAGIIGEYDGFDAFNEQECCCGVQQS